MVLFQLKQEVNVELVETLVRTSRSLLLKIPEVLNIRSGRNVDPGSPWPFFVAIEAESLAKLRIIQDSAYYLKFVEKLIKPNVSSDFTISFELDPSKNLKYS